MVDEVARTALVYDATQAKKGAQDFAQASQQVIDANRAVEAAEAKGASTVAEAENRKATARRQGTASAKAAAAEEAAAIAAGADAIDKATKRKLESLSSQTRFLDSMARRLDPFAQEVRKAQTELNRLQGIAGGSGENAVRAADLLTAATRRLREAEEALAASRRQKGPDHSAELEQVVQQYDRTRAAARNYAAELARVTGILDANKVAESDRARILAAVAAQHDLAAQKEAAAIGRVETALRQRAAAEDAAIANAWKLADANRAAAAAEQERNRAAAAQAQFNSVLGVRAPASGAAAQSAAAFEEAFRQQERLTAAAQRYKDALNPLLPLQRAYRAELDQINQTARSGLLSEQQRSAAVQRTKDAFVQQVTALRQVDQEGVKHIGTVRLAAHQYSNLGQQILDVGVSLQGGMNPFTVFVQQAPQAAFAVGGFSNLLKVALSVITPFTVGIGALSLGLAALTLRYESIAEQDRLFGATLRTTRREAELTTAQVRGLVEQMRALGTSRNDAIASLEAALRNPRVNAQQIVQIAPIAPNYAAAMGKAVPEAMRELTQAAADGYAGIVRLDEAFDFLSSTQLESIRTMAEEGNKVGAVAQAMDLLRERTTGAAREGVSPMSRAMTDLGRIYRGIVDMVLQNPAVKATLEGVAGALGWVADAVERFANSSGTATVATLNARLAESETMLANLRQSYDLQRQASPGLAAGIERQIQQVEAGRARIKAQIDGMARDAARSGVGIGQMTVADGPYNSSADREVAERYVQALERGQKGLADAYTRTGRARDIAIAQANAEREANERNIHGDERARLVKVRVAEATRQHSAASADFAVAARAAAAGAFLVADAAGKGEAAERAAAAQAAILAEQNNKGAEAFKQRALEEAAVLKITNETTRELERSTQASQGMAAAALLGAEAMAAETRAQYERSMALKLGADRTTELAQVMKAYDADRAAKLSEQANTEAARIQAQADATMRLAEATRFGSAAVEEAEVKNRLLAEATKLQIGNLDDQAGAIEKLRQLHPELVRAIEAEVAANKQLAAEQDKLKASRDKLVAQASAYVASISDPASRRAGELEIERLERVIDLTDKYKTVASGQGKALLDLFDETQAYREQERFWNDSRQMAEGYADDVKGYLLDGLTGATNSGKSIFRDMWDAALEGGKRFLINFALELAKQRFVMPILTSVIGSNAGAFGVVAPQTAGGALTLTPNGDGSFSLSNLPGTSSLGGGSFGGSWFQGILDTPLWGTAAGSAVLPAGVSAATGSAAGITSAGNLGAFTSEAALTGSGFATGSGAAAAPFTVGQALPGVGAALSIYNAATNPNIGTISGAALTTAGAAATMFPAMFGSLAALGPYGMIAGAILSILGNTIFKRKPSNIGAESSFSFDQLAAGAELDFQTLFRGDKHPNSLRTTDSLSAALQDTLSELAGQYGDVRFGGTFGANYGRKEGTSIWYGAPDITSVDQRSVFNFDPENDEEAAQAFADLSLAALRNADWDGLGKTVATAVKNSAATDLVGFLADVDFAKGFETTVDFLNKGWDPVTSQMAQIKKTAEEGGKAIAKTITDFLDKTNELWPSVTRSFDAAGNELVAGAQTVMQALVVEYGQANTEAEQAGAAIRDAAGNYYTFAGQIGDATLELTSASGEVVTATYDASTGVYELATSVTALGDSVATTITEMSAESVAGATAAKNFALGVLGLNDAFRFVHEDGVDVLKQGLFAVEPALTGLDLALEESRQGIQSLVPALEAAGVTAEEIALLIPAALARAEADIRANFALAAVAEQFSWNQRFNPGAVPTAAQAFASVGATRDATPVFFDTLNSFFLRAGAGQATQADFGSLETNFQNQAGYDILTDQQLNGLYSSVQGALQASLALQQSWSPANDNFDSGTSSAGGGSASDGQREQLQESLDLRRDELRVIKESISVRERDRDSYLDLAERTRRFRESLLLNTALTPLDPTLALAEARRQFEVTAAKAMTGDQDAIRDLEGVSTALLERSRAYYASTSGQLDKSTRYQEDFSRVQAVLLQVEGKARDYAAEAVAELVALNRQAGEIETAIGGLESSIKALGGTSGSPGSPGSPGTPADPATPPSYDFGYANLGRRQGESADAFMRRMFPTIAPPVAGSDNVVSDQEGYAWAQRLRDPTYLPGLTNAAYYASAIKASKGEFTGPFSEGAHTTFLRPGGVWNDERTRAFIDELRTRTSVPSGYFGGYAYATGGLVTGGIRGMDSVRAMLTPGEYVLPPAAVRRLGLPQLEAMRSGHGNENEVVDRLGKLVDLAARIIERQDAQIRQNEAAARHVGSKVEETTEAVRRARPRQTDPGIFKRAG